MYKAPPPEISSEQFYETDPARGFARGFSIQTVGPLPIGWAEHVLADGHWGRALREYMRDYNHWSTLGVLCELLPHAREPRHARRRERPARHADRPHGLHAVRQRPRQHRLRQARRCTTIWEAAGAQDTLTIDRYAHLVGGCRMGTAPEDERRSTPTTAPGASPNLFVCRRQRDADAGLRRTRR